MQTYGRRRHGGRAHRWITSDDKHYTTDIYPRPDTQERFEDTIRVIRSRKSKRRRTDNTMTKIKRTKGQTMIYKALHRKLKIEKQESY